jgi:4-hydroxy-tetrahydrodipicolinate synthase
MSSFRGAYTALVTPMKDGRVDDDGLTRLVEAQIEGGIDGLVPCGTTGESSTLSHAEHIRVVEVTMRATAGRVPVLAGAGSNCTREAIDLARACKELGVAGTLQITPYYNRPPQAGLVRHFEAIAEEVGLPIVLYNVPGRTGCDMLPETVAECAKHPNIVGIKEATGDMFRAAKIRELCGEDFALLSGDDFTLLPFLALGGDGVISVVTNAHAPLMVDLCKAVAAGNLNEARAAHYRQLKLTELLFADANPIPAKIATALLGLGGTEVRSPLRELPADGELSRSIAACMRELGILN